METPIIDPGKVPGLIAGGMGAFLSILFQRSASKLTMFTTLATAEVTTYYFATPIWTVMHGYFTWADDQWRGPVALTIGLLSIFVVGGVTKIFQDFWTNPLDTIVTVSVSFVKRVIPWKKGE